MYFLSLTDLVLFSKGILTLFQDIELFFVQVLSAYFKMDVLICFLLQHNLLDLLSI